MTDNSENQVGLSHPDTPSLYKKALRGGAWLFVLRFVTQLISLVKKVVLLRLLMPSDFGLLGIASLTMATMASFSEMGFEQALIQRKNNTEDYLDVAWTAKIIRGILLFIFVYLFAPLAVKFSNSPEAINIIRVIGLSMLIGSLNNIGVLYFTKELDFHKQFWLHSIGVFFSAIVTIVLAFIYRNVWALVFGKLAGNFVQVLLSYLMHPYRPRISFNLNKFKTLWGYGKHVFVTRILKFLCLNGDDILVVVMLGKIPLGFYRQAYEIGALVAVEIGGKVAEVGFSAYSKLQDNIAKIRAGYLKSVRVTSLVVFPVTGILVTLAPELVSNIIGQKWMPMVPAMQVLCLIGPFRCMQRAPVYQAIGRPDVINRITIVRLVIIAATVYHLTKFYGILGTSISVVIPVVVAEPMGYYYIKKLIGVKVRDVWRVLLMPVAGTLVMSTLIVLLKMSFEVIKLPELVLILGVSGIIYMLVLLAGRLLGPDHDIVILLKDIRKGF